MRELKLTVIQKEFSNYRKGIFDVLNEKYDLTLLHGNSKSDIKQVKTDYSFEVNNFKYGPKTTQVYLHIIPQLLKIKPDVVIHEFTPSLLSLYIVFLLKPFLKYKVILWGHGFNRSKGLSKKHFAYYFRRYLILKSDAVIFYGDKNRKIINNIWPSDKYFTAYNSLDTRKAQRVREKLKGYDTSVLKKELNITTKYNLIFIGRLKHSKILTEYFTSVIKNVQDSLSNIGVIIIGDGDCKEILQSLLSKNGIKNFYFTGAIYDEKLIGKYFRISDVMLMPGCVGLGVNHSFAYYKPVITFNEGEYGPFHGPEIEYVQNEKTGFLIPPFDTKKMADTILNYIENIELQISMKRNIKKCNQEKCNIYKMRDGFRNAIDYCTTDG